MSRNDFEGDWVPSVKDDKMQALARRYHTEAEAFDRTVCTGPIVDGAIQPFSRSVIGRLH